MDLFSVITLIFYSIPPVTTLTSCLLLLFSYHESDTPFFGSLRTVSLLFFLMSFLASFGIMIFPYSAMAFAVLTPVHYGAFISVPIFLYHLIWILTSGTNTKDKFSLYHYLFPLLFTLILQIWSFFIPVDVLVEIASDREKVVPGYELYSNIAHSRMQVRVFVNAIYLILVLLRIISYWKATGHSRKEYDATKLWFELLVSLSIVTFLAALMGVIKEGFMPYKSIGPFFIILLLSFLHIELVFRLIKGRFPLVEKWSNPYNFFQKKRNVNRQKKESSKKIEKDQFEAWFKQNKPYLNPSYSLSDLSKALNINRTYISNFINETYGINFARYLNQHRFEELQQLMKKTSNKNKTPSNLFNDAGFGSYRSYLRINNMMRNNKEE